MRMRLAVAIIAVLVSLSLTTPLTASAGSGRKLSYGDYWQQVDQWKSSSRGGRSSAKHVSSSQTHITSRGTSTRYVQTQSRKAFIAEYQRNLRRQYSACVANQAGACGDLLLGRIGGLAVPARQVGTTTPAISPQEAAYAASARLNLTAPKPMIGPSPDINRWKMAAVGYPLWLWADGNLNPAPVSDSVYDISVALDAHLVKVVFDMGDGHKVTCTNVSTQWTRAVKPGTASPACGYRYQKPSLPADSYTVTANAVWAVDWNISGTTGTIPFYQSASTTIPVGELQVLVR